MKQWYEEYFENGLVKTVDDNILLIRAYEENEDPEEVDDLERISAACDYIDDLIEDNLRQSLGREKLDLFFSYGVSLETYPSFEGIIEINIEARSDDDQGIEFEEQWHRFLETSIVRDGLLYYTIDLSEINASVTSKLIEIAECLHSTMHTSYILENKLASLREAGNYKKCIEICEAIDNIFGGNNYDNATRI